MLDQANAGFGVLCVGGGRWERRRREQGGKKKVREREGGPTKSKL